MMFSAVKNNTGFSLIETIIVIIVISVGAIGVLSVFTTGMKGAGNPLITIQAVELGQGELDQTIGNKKASGFAALPTGTGLACSTAAIMPAGFTCSRDICYVPSANLNDTSACSTATNYKRVEVYITHAAIGSATAVTLLTNY